MTKTLLNRGSRQAREINVLRAEKRQLPNPTSSSEPSSANVSHDGQEAMEDHIARFEKACERLQEAPGLQLDSAQSENKKARTAHIEKPSSSASLDQTEDATAAIPLKPVNREREDELARKCKELEQTLEVKTRACNVLVEEVQQLSATIENQRKAYRQKSEVGPKTKEKTL